MFNSCPLFHVYVYFPQFSDLVHIGSDRFCNDTKEQFWKYRSTLAGSKFPKKWRVFWHVYTPKKLVIWNKRNFKSYVCFYYKSRCNKLIKTLPLLNNAYVNLVNFVINLSLINSADKYRNWEHVEDMNNFAIWHVRQYIITLVKYLAIVYHFLIDQ